MIHLEEVTKEFDASSAKQGVVVATDRLNLHIPAGEIFGLVGPNGAGKTTTLEMICGLAVPTSGRVTVNDIDVERQPEEVQRHMGYPADFFSRSLHRIRLGRSSLACPPAAVDWCAGPGAGSGACIRMAATARTPETGSDLVRNGIRLIGPQAYGNQHAETIC